MAATMMVVECMFCGKRLREKPSFGGGSETSGICDVCMDLHYPQYADRVRELRAIV